MYSTYIRTCGRYVHNINTYENPWYKAVADGRAGRAMALPLFGEKLTLKNAIVSCFRTPNATSGFTHHPALPHQLTLLRPWSLAPSVCSFVHSLVTKPARNLTAILKGNKLVEAADITQQNRIYSQQKWKLCHTFTKLYGGHYNFQGYRSKPGWLTTYEGQRLERAAIHSLERPSVLTWSG